jgi:hypothetical protein
MIHNIQDYCLVIALGTSHDIKAMDIDAYDNGSACETSLDVSLLTPLAHPLPIRFSMLHLPLAVPPASEGSNQKTIDRASKILSIISGCVNFEFYSQFLCS